MDNRKSDFEAGAARVDSVLVSATCYLPNESALSARAREVARKVVIRSDSTVAVRFGTGSVESNDAEERQRRFEETCRNLLSEIREAGIDRDFVKRTNAHLRLSISLSPENGQAGIVLTQELLADWLDLQIDILLNAYSPE